MKENPHIEARAADYKQKLYNYVASFNTPSQPGKRLYSESAQCLIESKKKQDSSTYCSTCHTTNPYQWRLKLTSRRKLSKPGSKSIKRLHELALKCVVCHRVKKHHELKLKS